MTEIRFLALAALAALGPAAARDAQPAPATRVVMLGSGTPNADPDRSGPSVAIVVGNAVYLVDAGPGVVRRAALAQRVDSIAALRMPNLNHLFITHLHSDHTTGLPDVMLSPWVLDRTRPLEVYGPPGTARMVGLLQDAYSEDIQLRLHGGEPSNKTGYASLAHDVKAGVVYKDSNVTVSAFDVAHGKWDHAFGYKLVTRDRVIVISGDTHPTDAIVHACDGCDVLVHEVYSAKQLATRTPDWQAYHRAYHTSGVELGEIASRARPKLLVLYHQLYWGADDAELLREVREKFSGNVISGRDLGVY